MGLTVQFTGRDKGFDKKGIAAQWLLKPGTRDRRLDPFEGCSI